MRPYWDLFEASTVSLSSWSQRSCGRWRIVPPVANSSSRKRISRRYRWRPRIDFWPTNANQRTPSITPNGRHVGKNERTTRVLLHRFIIDGIVARPSGELAMSALSRSHLPRSCPAYLQSKQRGCGRVLGPSAFRILSSCPSAMNWSRLRRTLHPT